MTNETLPDALEGVKTYRVRNIHGAVIPLTGTGVHPLWEDATALTEFVYPWENQTPSCTTFKALHNEEWLYCLFTVCAQQVKIYAVTGEKSEILKSDRVEIFLKQDDLLSPYYGLEIDPLGRVYDYEAHYHRKFNTDWCWPKDGLRLKTSQQNEGYKVEIAIRKQTLRDLGLLRNNSLGAGLFRAECVEITGTEGSMKWISWVRPESKTPDFHNASSFGLLQLDD